MFPIGDDDSARRTIPVVTLCFDRPQYPGLLRGAGGGDSLIEKWAFVPSSLFLANPVADSLTILSSMFMHAGWVGHREAIMLYLWIFGDNGFRTVSSQFLLALHLRGLGMLSWFSLG